MKKTLMMLCAVSMLTGCKVVVSDFCRQVETIGYSRLLTKFTDEELRALKLDRKRALLAMRKTYDANCSDTSN